MATPAELEPDEYWGCAVPCNIEILCLFARQDWCGATLPPPDIARQWKATCLEVWERCAPAFYAEDFIGLRRQVLVRTIDELVGLAEKGGEGR